MLKNKNAAKHLFGLPGLTLLLAGTITLNSCEQANVTPGSNVNPVHIEDDPKPPKDGHGGKRITTITKNGTSVIPKETNAK